MTTGQLTQDERDKLIKDLRDTQQDINSKLAALGLEPEDKRDLKAPDGGPVSQAHTILKPVLRSLIPVVIKTADGGKTDGLINEAQFNPAIHTRVDDEKPQRRRREVKPVPQTDVSEHTRDELLVMTITMLRALPEVDGMDEIPSRKADLVEAILQAREDAE